MKEENKREIKFRIWDNAPIKDGFEGAMIDMEYAMQSDYLKAALNGDYAIMQYTGLKDCNGVDVYQWDILKGEEDIYSHGQHSIVEFYRGSFIISLCYDMTPITLSEQKMLYNPSDYPNTEKYNWLEGYQVIGNIHQNPELL